MNLESPDSVFGSPLHLAQQIVPEIEDAILQLVLKGFESWKESGWIRFGDGEDDYTARLAGCMKEVQREQNLALVVRPQDVRFTQAMFEGLEYPRRAPRIDLTVSWNFLNDDADFSIECKRLALGDLPRLYVADGMARFVTGRYGPKAGSGAMVGYLIRDPAATLLDPVNGQARAHLGETHILNPRASIGSFENVFISVHVRHTRFPPIHLTHLWVDCSHIPPLANTDLG